MNGNLKDVDMSIFYTIRRNFFRKKWRKLNKHNSTTARDIFPESMVSIGNYTYGEIGVLAFNDLNRIDIGGFCSIAPGVTFIVSADHSVQRASTFPFKSKIIDGSSEGTSKGNILIDDDVWIGHGATILSGVHIGQGAIVAAGAVVSKDVSPYTVVGGVPAKLIKNRFNQSVMEYMLTLDYGKLEESSIREHVDDLYTDLEGLPLGKIKELFSWFPKKDKN